MPISRLLIANRGEVAIRIHRAAANLGIETVAVHSGEDQPSLHVTMADQATPLEGTGPAAYLDINALIAAAQQTGCDAVHPGYGFLAESAAFAEAVRAAGMTFVGPDPSVLALFGDKSRARAAAAQAGVPVLAGTDGATDLPAARAFCLAHAGRAVMLKALAGGGGRGTRIVRGAEELEEAFARASSEAQLSFGDPTLYVEVLIERARHVEVQVLGDASGRVVHLGERECSVQRRHQKIVEIAPAPNLDADLQQRLHAAAVRLAESTGYTSLGTVEFLVDTQHPGEFAFIEANARLQVEHTVTEAVTGIDLVETQLLLAAGETLESLGLTDPALATPRGFAVQARVNMETLTPEGELRPAGGMLTAYEPPGGPGVRVDGFGYAGYETTASFDSLLAKVIVHTPVSRLDDAARRCRRALSEFRIEGVGTNVPLLANILRHDDFVGGRVTTRWVDDNMAALAANPSPDRPRTAATAAASAAAGPDGFAGARIDNSDPLALFEHDRSTRERSVADAGEQVSLTAADGSVGVPAPIQGTVVAVHVQVGDTVVEGQPLMVMEAMKMEHEIKADRSGIVRSVAAAPGDVIRSGHPLVFIEAGEVDGSHWSGEAEIDPDHIRADLAEIRELHAHGQDENRPRAVERRRRTGQRTARENIADLLDEDSFVEFGPMVLAAQRRRRTMEWLRENTPGDGVVMGLGHVNGDLFEDVDSRCVVVSYDYTVLAGTQGMKNHYKQDRMFELANRFRLPVVLYSEGGGGRPGDTDGPGGIGMDVYTFTQWSKLSGLVPLVGVNSGRCFAGNTALLGCCDVIIATCDSTIGMGGPAMIEGGGLGVFTPEEVAPMSMQVPNGVVDILVEDEAEATAVARKYLSYFQGPVQDWAAHDQRPMRHIVPENRLRMYDMRDVIHRLADVDSVLEIRKDYGIGIITCLVRIAGQPMGLIANNPHHLAGAIDSDGSDKGARFLQLCDAFDLPVISLMDCPGMMVGPEVEATALVRHCCRMFNTGANLSVPLFGLIIRKAYGLGVQAMCGGSSMVPLLCAAWPTAEFAGMNIEGSVKLGFRNDLAAIEDPEERLEKYNRMVESAYENAKAANAGTHFGIDDVIDPAESRRWIIAGLSSLPPRAARDGKKRPYIDTW